MYTVPIVEECHALHLSGLKYKRNLCNLYGQGANDRPIHCDEIHVKEKLGEITAGAQLHDEEHTAGLVPYTSAKTVHDVLVMKRT